MKLQWKNAATMIENLRYKFEKPEQQPKSNQKIEEK